MKKRITQDDYVKANRKASQRQKLRCTDTLFVTNECTSQRKYITAER